MQEGLLVCWVESPPNRKPTKTHTIFFEDLGEGYEFVKTKSAVIQCQRVTLVKLNG